MLTKMTARKLLLLSLSTLMPVLSFATTGVSDGAGGLSIDGKVIENYIVTSHYKMPDFDKVDALIKGLGDRVPNFGRLLKKIAHPAPSDTKAVTWFYLPGANPCAQIAAKTKVVATKFGCQMGSEIYISQRNLPTDPTERRDAYFHEILLMVSQGRSEVTVHKLIAFLKRNEYAPSPESLAEELLETGYAFMTRGLQGDALTKSEEDKINARHAASKKAIAENNQDALRGFTDGVLEICNAPMKTDEGLQAMQAKLNDLSFNLVFEEDLSLVGPEIKTVVGTMWPTRNESAEDEINWAIENGFMDILKNDRVASLLAALDSGSPYEEWDDNGGHIYPSAIAKWIFQSLPYSDKDDRTVFRWSSADKIAGLQKKYKNYSSLQRQAQVCADAKALNQSL